MRILLLTSSSLRHFALAATLSAVGHVTVIAETRRLAPLGGPAMAEYLRRMDQAEAEIFGGLHGHGEGTFSMIPFGALSQMRCDVSHFDQVIVFGSSWIKPPLLDAILPKQPINLHAGLAPEYRGSACNFWASYDGRSDLVGATLHRLTAGLDAGPILMRLGAPDAYDPWRRGMLAIRRGQDCLRGWVAGERHMLSEDIQDERRQIRVSRHAEFTEAVCAEYLARQEVVYASA